MRTLHARSWLARLFLAWYALTLGAAMASPLVQPKLLTQVCSADGGMVLKESQAPRPFWLYYINVASVDMSAARITASGGQVLMGPHQVPGGNWIVLGTDPQGARLWGA